MPDLRELLGAIGLAQLALAAGYVIMALVAALVWRLRRAPAAVSSLPPISVLKPLCGDEPDLYRNLRSFCLQRYPEFQIVFGVRDANDPAVRVVRRLQAEFPCLPIDLVIDSAQHGSNRKVSNLINMLARARHDVLAMADSDVVVRPDYLAAVTAPLRDPQVGLVTCIFRDVPTSQVWSRLGAMYVNEWFMPSVLLAWLFGHAAYSSGQTLCMRRETLEAIGGLDTIANHLAEDHQLGELVRARGQRIALSPYLLRTARSEASFALLSRHELRWMRTLQVLRPRSFRLLFLSFSLPLALVGGLLALAEPAVGHAAWALMATTVAARLALYLVHRLGGERALFCDLWLMPVRDLLMCWIWFRSFFAARLTWGGDEFSVGSDGIMRKPS
jgi:ceramide glucosyltransferase